MKFTINPFNVGADARELHDADLEHQAAIVPAWSSSSDAFDFYRTHGGLKDEDWREFQRGWDGVKS